MTIAKPAIVAVVLTAALAACSSPSKPNIALRKQNAALRQEVASLKRAREGDAATIRTMEGRATTVPVLPNDRLAQLYTVHGLKLGRLTGGWDKDRQQSGDEGLQIFVVPTDQTGDLLKASGGFVIDAFDLAQSGENRIGHWEFSPDQAMKAWLGTSLQYGYVFELPWQNGPPAHDQVTVRVTFTDELTGRAFTAQRVLKIVLPPRAPATQSVTQR